MTGCKKIRWWFYPTLIEVVLRLTSILRFVSRYLDWVHVDLSWFSRKRNFFVGLAEGGCSTQTQQLDMRPEQFLGNWYRCKKKLRGLNGFVTRSFKRSLNDALTVYLPGTGNDILDGVFESFGCRDRRRTGTIAPFRSRAVIFKRIVFAVEIN